MKKLISVLSLVGIAGSLLAQSWTLTTVTVPNAITCTNLYNGPTRLLSMSITRQGTGTVATTGFKIFDSPRIQPYIGGAGAGENITNGIVFTNAGYYFFSQVCSNINFNGTNPTKDINAFTNYAGVVTTITNSSALSNYCFSVSNNVAGVLMTNRLVFTGSAPTNTTTTFDFSSVGGIWFGKGLSLSNSVAGAFGNGDTVQLTHDPIP